MPVAARNEASRRRRGTASSATRTTAARGQIRPTNECEKHHLTLHRPALGPMHRQSYPLRTRSQAIYSVFPQHRADINRYYP